MRGQYRPTTATGAWAVEDRESVPTYAQGVAAAPEQDIPVTAVPGGRGARRVPHHDPYRASYRASYPDPSPATAIPATAIPSWDGPSDWDDWHHPVAYPKAPQWGGQPEPPRQRGKLLRTLVIGLLLAALVPLFGAAALFGVLNSRSDTPTTQATPNAAPKVVAPLEPSDEAPPPSPVPDATLDTDAIVDAVDDSVVNVNSTLGLQNTRGAGTGVILRSSGLVLTNNHVIAGATAITVAHAGLNKTFKASVVGFDRS